MKRQTETALVKQCLELLHLHGCVAWRNNVGGMQQKYRDAVRWVHFGVPGLADIIGCTPGGRFIAVECKVKRNKVSPPQANFLEKIRQVGGLAIVSRDTPDELLAALAAVLAMGK